MPKWKYFDGRGVEHIGEYQKCVDCGGTDITYFFRDEKTNDLSLVSGANLKRSHPIYAGGKGK